MKLFKREIDMMAKEFMNKVARGKEDILQKIIDILEKEPQLISLLTLELKRKLYPDEKTK
jgi:hypothetical protein